jgi:putative transcriptional regulator
MKAQQGPAASADSPLPSLNAGDVRAIRYKLGQSQLEFATMIGVTLPMLQSWEEGKRVPDGPALALLRVTAKNPKIVAKALAH